MAIILIIPAGQGWMAEGLLAMARETIPGHLPFDGPALLLVFYAGCRVRKRNASRLRSSPSCRPAI